MTDENTGRHQMDDMTLLRAVLAPPPPPGPQVTTQARQRLLAQAGRGAGRRPVPAGPQRPRGRRWLVPLTGVAAAGLAGALAVAVLLPGGGAHRGRGSAGLVTSERPLGSLTGQPAHPFLLGMATRMAAAQPAPAIGRYWCQTMVAGQLDPIGPGGQELTPAGEGETPSPVTDYRYSIFARQSQADCLQYGKLPSGSIGGYYNDLTRNIGGYVQDLGARPATARDAAAWRRDGSPAWKAWYQTGLTIPAHPEPRRAILGKPGSSTGRPIPLPTDPAKLRAALLAGQGSSHYSGPPQQVLYAEIREVLISPATPALRAAAYQVLAGLPGIQMKPGVRDPAGRPGTALWLGSPDQIMIVDPATGMLLADEWIATGPHGVYAPGTVTQYALWQKVGWSNRIPR